MPSRFITLLAFPDDLVMTMWLRDKMFITPAGWQAGAFRGIALGQPVLRGGRLAPTQRFPHISIEKRKPTSLAHFIFAVSLPYAAVEIDAGANICAAASISTYGF